MPDRFVIPSPKPGPFVLGPDAQRQPGVPRGTVTKAEWRSAMYHGTVRDYYVYVPAQYTPSSPANVMIFQDGWSYANEEGDAPAPIVFDNLIHQRRMPVTIGLFINPGVESAAYTQDQRPLYEKYPGSQRSAEYDVLSDRYARFLLEEMLPAVGERYRLTQEANGRAICGASSGGICAWTVAWERPDAFSKVLSHVGSFADVHGGHVYPTLIRKTPRKPIRVFIQAGSNDADCVWGSWQLANLEMAAALNFAGYDYRLDYGDGAHDYKHGGASLPEALTWLWR